MRKIIFANGREQELPEPVSIRELASLINAKVLDTVILHGLGADPLHVMCVDDQGYQIEEVETRPGHFELQAVLARKRVNIRATQLYHEHCKPGTTHAIVGDVAIVPDSDYARR